MTGDKQLISGDSWRDSEAAKREKGGLGVQKSFWVPFEQELLPHPHPPKNDQFLGPTNSCEV
jgi:hypothetical protein